MKHKRRAAQVIIVAIGSVGPENVDDAAVRIVAALAEAQRERDKLAGHVRSLAAWVDIATYNDHAMAIVAAERRLDALDALDALDGPKEGA